MMPLVPTASWKRQRDRDRKLSFLVAWDRDAREGIDYKKGIRELSGMTGRFCVLILVVVSQPYIFVKTH